MDTYRKDSGKCGTARSGNRLYLCCSVGADIDAHTAE